MQITQTSLPGVQLITPRRFGDARGWFSETWSAPAMAARGLHFDFVQDNHSMSGPIGTLRGLHYQRPPFAQDKLVRCTKGTIFDVAVDFRAGSPRFGQWFGTELSAENGAQLLVPKGFLHGFITRTEGAEVQYKVTAPYAPECDGAVTWNDPDLGIDWGHDAPLLSGKDAAAPRLCDTPSPFPFKDFS